MTAPPPSFIGVDVGGTKIAAGIVTFPAATMHSRRQIATAPARGPEAVLSDVFSLCEKLAEAAHGSGGLIAGIGVGICELVDRDGKVASRNCLDWIHLPARERLSQLAPTVIEADVRAAALAESAFGAGKPFRQFVYITVGTGISSCLILDGEPFTGAHGATGTMASSPLSVPCEHCGELNHRTLEEIASGPALLARYNQQSPTAVENAESVLAAAIAGDPLAVQVVASGAETLGFAAGWLVNVLDPEAIVVGGGLGLSGGPYWERFVASTRRHIWAEDRRALPVLQAATGQDAGLIGAAVAAWRKH